MIPRGLSILGILGLLLAACSPAATPTRSQPASGITATATPNLPPTSTAVAAIPTATRVATPGATSTPTPKRGGILKVEQRRDATNFDQQRPPYSRDEAKNMNLVFSRLATYAQTPEIGCNFQLSMDIAESWGWVSDDTFQVKIRPGVRFQDKPPVKGRELTSEDVAFSFQRLREKQSAIAALAKLIKDIRPVDRYTVVFQTDGRLPALLPDVIGSRAGANILAKESGDPKQGWEDPFTSYIGSGPMMFKDYRMGVKVSFERHPNYWRTGKPYVEGAEFLIIPDMSTRVAALLSGKLDMISFELPTPDALRLKQQGRLPIYGCPDVTGTARINMRTDKAPWNDVRVRRAISMAVDRKAMIDVVFMGEALWVGVEPPGIPGALAKPEDFPPDVRPYLEYNVPRAKQLLAEAGFPMNKEFPINMMKYGFPYDQIFEFFMQSMADLGIKVKANVQVRGEYANTTQQGDFSDLAFIRMNSMEYFAAYSMYRSDQPGDRNRSRANDPELDNRINAFLRTITEADQAKAARDVQVREADQAYFVTAPTGTIFAATNPWVHDFYYGPGVMAYTAPWVENVWLSR